MATEIAPVPTRVARDAYAEWERSPFSDVLYCIAIKAGPAALRPPPKVHVPLEPPRSGRVRVPTS